MSFAMETTGSFPAAPLQIKDEITLRNQLESPLLRLPAEIRNNIYGHVLGGHEPHSRFRIPGFAGDKKRRWTLRIHSQSRRIDLGKHKRLLAITETCRQLQNETKLLVFTLNSISGDLQMVRRCLKKLAGGVAAKNVHTLCIIIYVCSENSINSLWYDETHEQLIKLVKMAPNVRQVVLYWDGSYGPLYDGLEEYHGQRFLETSKENLVKLGRDSDLLIDLEHLNRSW